MNIHIRVLLSTLAVLFVAGCYSTSVAHWTAAEAEWIAISKTQHGYSVGPCGFVEGGTWVEGEIQLKGKKEKYTDGDFTVSFPGEFFKTGDLAPQVSGTIAVDWSRHKIVVDLTERRPRFAEKSPCRINGSYSFREEKGPNQLPEPTSGIVTPGAAAPVAPIPPVAHR